MLANRHRTAVLQALALAGTMLVPAATRAQAVDADRAAAAQTLFDRAMEEIDKKQYVTACRKLEEVTRLVPDGIGAKLALAGCYEAQGKLASAWSTFALVETLAAKAGQTDRSKEAGARAGDLLPRLAMLTVKVPSDARIIPGILVTRDGVPLGEAQWGTAVPVDPGAHRVSVTAPGHSQWSKTVEIVANGVEVSVEVHAPVPEVAAEPEVPAPRAWQRPAAIAAFGVGGAGVVLGSVLGALVKPMYDDARVQCGPAGCPPAAVDLGNRARALGDGATAAFVIGGIALAGGVGLWLTAPPGKKPANESPPPVRIAAAADVSPGRAGIVLKGEW